MMKVEAVVVRDRVETVMDAVESETGHVGVTVVEAVGHGKQTRHHARVPGPRLPVAVPAEGASDVRRRRRARGARCSARVADAARTGHVSGDGICWMSPVTNVTHNRTGAKLEEVEAL